MAMIFYLLGALAIVAGLGWSGLVIGLTLGGSAVFVAPGAGVSALVIAALPGVVVAFGGLLLLAVGRALRLLALIARNTRDPVRGFVNTAPVPPRPKAAGTGKPKPPPAPPPPPPQPPPRPPDAPKPPSFMDFDISRERR